MAKLKLLDWLKVNKRNFALAIYEQFVQSEYDYIRGVLKHIGKYDEKCDRTGDEDFDDNSYIHRVHNGDLEEYATNVDEVLQFYSTHSYPTWAECCGRFHEEAHPLALPRPSTEGNGNASATR